MEITIKDKTYELNFGIRFSHKCNQIFFPNGMENPVVAGGKTFADFGMGVKQLAANLKSGNASAIYQMLVAAVSPEEEPPTMEDVDAYITEQAEKGKSLQEICDFFLEELCKSPSLSGLEHYLNILGLIKTGMYAEVFKSNMQTLSEIASSTSDIEKSLILSD